MQSSGGFLPNGHPASSLAQDLVSQHHALHARAMHLAATSCRATSNLRRRAGSSRTRPCGQHPRCTGRARNASSGSDSSSGSDRPHTPPPPSQHQQGLGIRARQPLGPTQQHVCAAAQQQEAQAQRVVECSARRLARRKQEGRRRASRHGGRRGSRCGGLPSLLASSPSPSSIKRFSADTEAVGTNGILSTPAQTSLWDPFNSSGADGLSGHSGGRRSRMQSSVGGMHGLGIAPRHTSLSSSSTPLTPPPSARKHARESGGEMVGLASTRTRSPLPRLRHRNRRPTLKSTFCSAARRPPARVRRERRHRPTCRRASSTAAR